MRIFVTLPVIAFIVFAAPFPSARAEPNPAARELASLLFSEGRVDALATGILKSVEAIADGGQLKVPDAKQLAGKLESDRVALMKTVDWGQFQSQLATHFDSRYSEDELRQLLEFFKKDPGKKLLENRPELAAEMITGLVSQFLNDRAAKGMVEGLARLKGNLGKEEWAEVEKAMLADPFPSESFLGRWYGKDISEDDYPVWWWYEKREDGSQVETTVSMDREEKTYDRYKDTIRWRSKGRLLFEVGEEDEGAFYIIESVVEDEIIYRSVDEELPIDEWVEYRDRRKPIEMPERPDGYKTP